MIILAIVATLGAVLWSLFVMFANGPSAPFQGGVSITLAWLGAIVLWAAWVWG